MSGKDDVYPACYRDRYGTEHIAIRNDGSELKFTLRGLGFVASEWDSFSPARWDDPDYEVPEDVGPFPLHQSGNCAELVEYELTLAIPVVIRIGEIVRHVPLELRVEVGPPSTPSAERSRCQYRVVLESAIVLARLAGCSFEHGLQELARKLPPGHRLECCFTCDFSDYFPGGNSDFGDLSCYRNCKHRYRQVQGKLDLFKLEAIEKVQETYLCPEYEPRARRRGYRG